MTEKAVSGEGDRAQCVFVVNSTATKIEIKKAVEKRNGKNSL